MEIREAKLLYNANFTLGEGAFWHNDWQQFVFIDIKGKKLGRINADGTGLALKNLPKMPGVVRATTAEKLVIAWQGELVAFDFETEATEVLQLLEPEILTNRSNDGSCDAVGRFWFGTMDTSAKLNAGNFYCYDGKLQKKLAGTSVSNGISWSVDNKTLYYIDSFDFNIKAYDFDLATATMGNPKVIVTMPNKDLVPDGMCIDADGMLWVAIWGGSCVHRYHPQTGELLAIVKVPAPHVTSVAFGGSNLQTLLITTAKDGLSDDQLKEYPLSGSLFTLDTTIRGTLTNSFKMPL